MRTSYISSAVQAPLCQPEILRQARVRQRVSVSEAVARVMASHAYGEGREPEPWLWAMELVEAKTGCRS